MSDEQILYEEIRRRVEKHYQRLNRLITHIALFLAVNLMIWAYVLFGSIEWIGNSILDRAAFTLAWLVLLTAHGINFANSERKERAIQEAIERQQEWELQMAELSAEKAKREEAYLRLVGDGELVSIDDDERDTPETRQSEYRP